MKIVVLVLVLIFSFSFSCAQEDIGGGEQQSLEKVQQVKAQVNQLLSKGKFENEILVKLKNEFAATNIDSIIDKNFVSKKLKALKLQNSKIFHLKCDSKEKLEKALEDLLANDKVAVAEPNYIFQHTRTPNDPEYRNLWGMNKIQAPKAWDISTKTDIIVAVIDTGVDYNHPDLKDNMWINPDEIPGNGIDDDGNDIVDDIYGANFIPEQATGDPMDDVNHGTHCAGTIGAIGNNNLGVVGVAWNVKIMALKFLGPNGGTTTDAIEAIDYAIEKGAHVLSNSWGGGGFSRLLKEAIERSHQKNCVFVAAHGNDGRNTSSFYPSSYDVPNIISVVASDNGDELATFSNYSKHAADIAAPGVGILSTVPGTGYKPLNGTSMATPHVAGAVALAWGSSAHSHLNNLEIINLIYRRADPVDAFRNITTTGKRLNIGNVMSQSVSRGLTGLWEIEFDYGCDGGIAKGKIAFNGNNSWSYNGNIMGRWFKGKNESGQVMVVMNFDEYKTVYVANYDDNTHTLEGIMGFSRSGQGCWQARKIGTLRTITSNLDISGK